MYYTIKLCDYDKRALNSLLSKYTKTLGERLVGRERVDLDAVGDELKIISNIRYAIENAEEVPHGKE